MKLYRREVLIGGGVAALSLRCGGNFELGLKGGESYDEVLTANFKADFEFPRDDGFANHVPMVADALVLLGREDRLASWAETYGKKMRAFAVDYGEPLSSTERAGAINLYDLRGRWITTYLEDLKTLSPKQLVQQEWAFLRGGLLGSLWHGLLRTAHAARAIDRQDSEVRRHELAEGLSYWISRCPQLEAVPGARAVSGRTVRAALEAVPLVPTSERITTGSSDPRLLVVNGRQDFTDAIEAVDLDAQPYAQAMTEIVAAAARLHANVGGKDIHTLHGVTGSSALRLLLPWLTPAQQREAVGYAFAGVAATLATQGKSDSLDAVSAPSRSKQSLLDEAAVSNDEHDMKYAEVVQRECALDERPEFLASLQKLLA
jgi:hypothetical protein